MLSRVSTDMSNNDMSYYLRRQEESLNAVQNRMGSQSRLFKLRDDPLAAAHAVRLDSTIGRLKTWEGNALRMGDEYAVAEGNVASALGIMQRARELAVQGASGLYSPEDRKAMATEVDQLLRQLVEIGNSKLKDGRSVFAGDATGGAAFRAVTGFVPGAGEPLISRVDYLGSAYENPTEFMEGASMPSALAGNGIFWAEKQQVFSAADARGYAVPADATIRVDGIDVRLSAGDNVAAVIAKINASGAPVKAYLDPVKSSLALEGTTPHQLWLEDSGGVLQDLGIVRDAASPPPYNYAPTARVSGGSLFDAVIGLRDAFLKGDVLEVGGKALGSVDQAMSSLTGSLATMGARKNRLDAAAGLYGDLIPKVTAQYAREADLDFSEAAMDLSRFDASHKAALSVAGKTLQPTLLDFLK